MSIGVILIIRRRLTAYTHSFRDLVFANVPLVKGLHFELIIEPEVPGDLICNCFIYSYFSILDFADGLLLYIQKSGNFTLFYSSHHSDSPDLLVKSCWHGEGCMLSVRYINAK
ncbi:hypothetical protein Dfer_4636 [Dyadobacter fermentans DSM 18053]|uniref:Uncharacterized protein n=1 Tax=Dyadobacter fermentans (strain ATCC 700827 / DSM 18053 / CIP 107007 / KCTC 52180 / NS114) TaxID=471854 RepID=C6W3Y9_DYAFD|nr:hypothetical protein Dfer_4636 [Dyadobacter fermentans DSM 18053]